MRHASKFRKYARGDSWAGVVFVALLAAFDLYIFVYLIYQLWPRK